MVTAQLGRHGAAGPAWGQFSVGANSTRKVEGAGSYTVSVRGGGAGLSWTRARKGIRALGGNQGRLNSEKGNPGKHWHLLGAGAGG